MDERSKFALHLCNNGLNDTAFWLPQLGEKLGVKSKAALDLLEGDMDSFSKVEEVARYPVERKALRKLLKIDEMEQKKKDEKKEKKKEGKLKLEKANEKGAQQKKELQEREERAQEILKNLVKARLEGKDRHNERVQKLEVDMREALNISPESWISKDKSLDVLISKLEERQKMSGQLQARDSLNDSMLLQRVSGGRALHGILLTKRLEERLANRERLLEAPEDVLIMAESLSDTKSLQFSSEYQENNYRKAIEVLGYSVAVSANIPVHGAAIGVGVSTSHRTEDETTHKQNVKEIYSSTVKYSTMEVASYSFGNRDLKLSEDPMGDLHNVLKLLKIYGAESGYVEKACERFFHTYGSHVNRGPLRFGGNFWWTCSSKGFSQNETKIVKKMQSDAISTTAGISFAGFGVSSEVNIDKIKGSYQGKCSESTLASTSLQVKITGGPPEATDLSLWMTGLVANNSTWILTDRGKKLIPVWDIIRKNYKELGEISEVLRSTWERMSGLKAEQDLSTKLSYDSEAVLEEVSEWNEEENLMPRQIEDNLKYLLLVKKDILGKTGNPSIWISEYLSDPNLQEFLESVVDSATSQFEHIKFQMQMLFEPEELKQFDTRTFPGIEQVSEWLRQLPKPSSMQKDIPDFQSFDNFLEKTLEEARIAQLSSNKSLLENSAESQETIATDVSKGILSLRSHYQQTYDDVLITILVHPFQSGNYDNVITLNPITLDDLESMCKHFSEQRLKFDQYVANRRPLHLQAYLFKLAVDLCGEAERSQFQQLLQQITQMMRALCPPLEQELEECLDHRGSYLDLMESLQYLMTKPLSSQPPLTKKDDISHSLRDALHTETCRHKVSQDDHSLIFKENPTVHTLFKKLGLGDFYPKKLQLKDALCIRPESLKLSLNETHPTDLKQLPYLVLHKLMVYDVLCRSDLMPHSLHSVKKELDDYDDYDDDDGGNKSNDSNDRIHPLDTLLALIFCSDEFLCQDLLSRLAICQLSVPFILPDPFTKQLTIPLWAMRSIIKEWKCTMASGEVVQQTQPIVNYAMPIVSFIGFQKQKNGRSKSIILNEVISESHSHFFHRDCPGGHYNCLLGEGLVDMCWYLPAGQAADAFPDAVTFLNLHGDARQHLQQIKFLSQISFMCIVLLTEEVTESDRETMEILKMFSSCPGGITLLDNVGKNPKRVKEEIPGVYAINLTKKNASEIKFSIQERIKRKLTDNEKYFQTIEDRCKIKQEGIFVDEDSDSHKEGLSLANEVKSIITGHEAGMKKAMLPLQGKGLWQVWAAQDRELYRHIHRGAQTVNEYNSDMERKKAALRKQQMKHVESLTPVMESFIVSLLKLGGSSNSILRNCFLQCLKLELDNFSRENISVKQHEYQAIKGELNKFQGKSVDQKAEVKIKQCKDEMKVLQDDIINASIGLEHLFREVGQVYEAAVQSSKYGDELSRLPKAVAELLIEGYPLEVMDGDAAHVPLKWVVAVFNEAVKMLEDPKVFVLSVLGLQSTGKSTMLNTAFGLQFNVSAGRCTRGAFIQLLPLDEMLRKETKCDYVLVVDTEGLRAIELDSLKTQKHDNELATFVIGLANMTLINIYGEVPGDMDDILQTSVHAFLRMNKVKFYPSCQFVHQNAGSNVKSEVGRTKFTQKLNKFTVDAASEEHCEGQYKTFNDVIMFDDQKDVHHFPGLLKGDPPMAPVNHGYSHSAQMLKLSCIKVLHERVSKGSQVGILHLSSFPRKVDCLWNTLLKENFVFSFKNTLEITAYNSLETEFGKWDWEFHGAMIKWEIKAENEISTAKSKDVPDLVEQKRNDLKEHVSQMYQHLKSEMGEFFEGKQAEILVQWKVKFEKRLTNLAIDSQEHAEKLCTKLRRSREAISKIEGERNEYAKKITKKVQEYIVSLKQNQEKLNQNLEKLKLESSQLKEILKKELFTTEKLEMYKCKQLITPDQVCLINEVIQQSDGQLTESGLKGILVGQILGMYQVKKILKMGQQTEEQLKHKFDLFWIDLVEQLPFVTGEKINVEVEVERKLSDFVYGSQGQLFESLNKKSLTQVASLDLMLEKETHYEVVEGIFKRGMKAVTRVLGGKIVEADPHHIEALEITDRVFRVAREYLGKIEKKDTDFNVAFTQELLHKLDSKINEEFAAVKGRLSFTREYRLDVYLTACGYAVPKFKKMSESFTERHDPRLYLERKIKGPLFTKFKNQYYQAEAEEAIANTLCAHLEEPIKTQVGNKLGSKMVGLMKASEQHFSSKMALKVKILTDLHEKDNFESYMHYVTDVKGCLEEWIKYSTIEFCDKNVSDKSTRLQVSAKDEVTQFIGVVENKVNDLNETDVHQWVTVFSEDAELRSELGVNLEADDLLSGYESLQLVQDLENLKRQIRAGLEELKDKLHASFHNIQCKSEIDHWKDKPHDILKSLIGCTEQCPFCGEQCDLLDPNHVATGRDHNVSVHRSTCLQGYRDTETGVMTTGFCPAYVSGEEKSKIFRNAVTNQIFHPFKDYKSKYPKWSIPPDITSESSLYWKMFVGRFMKAIAERYKAKPAKVPDGWSKVTWEEVRENLRSLHNY